MATSPTATGCTSPPTAAGPGCTWASPTPGTSARYASTRRDPDRVWVAALGHAFGPNPQRGVFLSTDGGASWDRVLYGSDRAGAADLALDARNPTVLYASLWEVHRNFWELASGGPGSGLWRSTDGGTTWTEITPNLGLPASATLGKIGVAASPARSGRVWALVESDAAPGLYRSDDFGDTWTLASDRQDLRYRPWYYMHVFADPRDEDTVYVNKPSDVEVDRRRRALHAGAYPAR